MSSKVATRTNGSTQTATTTQSRRVPFPIPSRGSNNVTMNGNAPPPSPSQPPPPPSAPPPYTSRRIPPAEYSIEKVVKNGVPTEVLTIEDTPEPGVGGVAGPSGDSSGYGSSSSNSNRHRRHPHLQTHYHQNHHESNGRTESGRQEYGDQHSSKRRKNDGTHISDLPYSSAASHRPPLNTTGHDPYSSGSKPNGAVKNKRKLDAYEGYSQGRESGSGRDSQRPSQRSNKDLPLNDKEGHFIVRIGDVIKDRFTITRPLGQGTFGKVVCAKDLHSKEEVAIKVIRAVPKYREASKVEIKVLTLLKKNDPHNHHKCIHLLQTFDHRGHICLVTELLSASVFDFLKENHYQSFPFSHIQDFAWQLLSSVHFIHKLQLIHTDLKPENILLETVEFFEVESKGDGKTSKGKKRVLKDTNIRLIDFGSATFENEYHATVVSTRHYRAPEIILGMGWSYPCDVWSIGCILIEFFTGEALFQTHENVEHLAMMRKVFGEMPESFIEGAVRASHPEWFRRAEKSDELPYWTPRKSCHVLDYPNSTVSKQSLKFVKQMRSLKDIIHAKEVTGLRFVDLLDRLLQWDPVKRITVGEALKHPFFSLKINDEGAAARGSSSTTTTTSSSSRS